MAAIQKSSGGSSNGRGRTPRSVRAKISAAVKSKFFRPSPDPPLVSMSPWHTDMLFLGSKGDLSVTIKELGKSIRTRYSLAESAVLMVRVVEFRVWSATARPLSLVAHPIIGWDGTTEKMDLRGNNTYARAGFRWSADDQAIAVKDTSDLEVVFIDVAPEASWLAYCQVLWRVPGTGVSQELGDLLATLRIGEDSGGGCRAGTSGTTSFSLPDLDGGEGDLG